MTQHIAETAKIGKDCTLGKNVVILDNVQVGDGTYIGHNVIIHEGTKIGKNVYIDDGCILGRVPRSGASSRRKVTQGLPPLEIGDECTLGVNVVIYTGTKVGNQVMVADMASIRELNTIGDKCIIGRLVMMEPKNNLGFHVVIETASHICGDMIIEDHVFMASEISTSNGNYMGRGTGEYKGPHIKMGARIACNCTLLPYTVIGEQAVVAAGALVSRDVPDKKLVMGIPAKVIRDVPENELLK